MTAEEYIQQGGFGDPGAKTLAAAFAIGAFPCLEELSMGFCNIGDDGFTALSQTLSLLPVPIEINFTYNKIGDAGITAFAQAIKPVSEGGRGAVPLCQILLLDGNLFGDAGIIAFAQAISGGALSHCKGLGLTDTIFGDIGITAFAQAIMPVSEGGGGAMPSLEELSINGPMAVDPTLKAACEMRDIDLQNEHTIV